MKLNTKLSLYEIDDSYINYLSKYDPKIEYTHEGDRIHTRKYLGVIFKLKTGYMYFAPLSTPKHGKDFKYYFKNGKKHIAILHNGKDNKKALCHFYNLIKDNEFHFGKIMLGNMIPIPNKILDSVVKKFDIGKEVDESYKNKIIEQSNLITKQREIIRSKAIDLYLYKLGYKKSNSVKKEHLNDISNFRVLEKESLHFDINKTNLTKSKMKEKFEQLQKQQTPMKEYLNKIQKGEIKVAKLKGNTLHKKVQRKF